MKINSIVRVQPMKESDQMIDIEVTDSYLMLMRQWADQLPYIQIRSVKSGARSGISKSILKGILEQPAESKSAVKTEKDVKEEPKPVLNEEAGAEHE